MTRGRFVVVEGIDGSGTTTQVRKLGDRLRDGTSAASLQRGQHQAEKLAVHTTREPSDGPIGALLRQILTGAIVVPGPRGPGAPGWGTMALLFAADRMDHVQSEIAPHLDEGAVVVSDRYDASSLAYQSAVSGSADSQSTVNWIRELNKFALRPHLTIVLHVSVELAAERRALRGEPAQLYEQNEVQQKLVAFYADLAKHMPNDRVAIVDGSGTISDVHDRIYAAYARAFGGS